MGIQDREWYWKDREEKERAARSAEAQTAQSKPPATRRHPTSEMQPPKLWGADWHWSLQLLVWLAIAVLLLMIWRMVR